MLAQGHARVCRQLGVCAHLRESRSKWGGEDMFKLNPVIRGWKKLNDYVCEDGELVLMSLMVILEDQSVTFNNKHLPFYLKYLQLSRLRIRCRETQMRWMPPPHMHNPTCMHACMRTLSLPGPSTMLHLSNSWSLYDKRQNILTQARWLSLVIIRSSAICCFFMWIGNIHCLSNWFIKTLMVIQRRAPLMSYYSHCTL